MLGHHTSSRLRSTAESSESQSHLPTLGFYVIIITRVSFVVPRCQGNITPLPISYPIGMAASAVEPRNSPSASDFSPAFFLHIGLAEVGTVTIEKQPAANSSNTKQYPPTSLPDVGSQLIHQGPTRYGRRRRKPPEL